MVVLFLARRGGGGGGGGGWECYVPPGSVVSPVDVASVW